jgi:hypothetical protein
MSTDSDRPADEGRFSRHDFLRLIVAGATAGFVVPAIVATSASADPIPPILNPPPGGEPPIIQGPVSSGSLTSSTSSTSSITSSTSSSGSVPPPITTITFNTPAVENANGAAVAAAQAPASAPTAPATLQLPSLRSLW